MDRESRTESHDSVYGEGEKSRFVYRRCGASRLRKQAKTGSFRPRSSYCPTIPYKTPGPELI